MRVKSVYSASTMRFNARNIKLVRHNVKQDFRKEWSNNIVLALKRALILE